MRAEQILAFTFPTVLILHTQDVSEPASCEFRKRKYLGSRRRRSRGGSGSGLQKVFDDL
jgi:hypothetical protein